MTLWRGEPTTRVRFHPLLATFLLVGCVSAVQVTRPTGDQDPAAARSTLRRLLLTQNVLGIGFRGSLGVGVGLFYCGSPKAVRFRSGAVEIVLEEKGHISQVSLTEDLDGTRTYRVALSSPVTELKCASQCSFVAPATIVATQGKYLCAPNEAENAQFSFATESAETLKTAADAWNVLVAHAAQMADQNSEAEFAHRAEQWRATEPKPPLPEPARRHKVLAETAFHEQKLDRAIEEYEAALEIEPVWPDGNFNLALLYESESEYPAAIHYMRRFLALVPDGPDSKAARDKLIVWEDKVAQP